jgi:hypothetical protein
VVGEPPASTLHLIHMVLHSLGHHTERARRFEANNDTYLLCEDLRLSGGTKTGEVIDMVREIAGVRARCAAPALPGRVSQ